MKRLISSRSERLRRETTNPLVRGLSASDQRTLNGGGEGTRTPDPLHAMQVRYQLRHTPAGVVPE